MLESINYTPLLCALVLIVGDIITGVTKGFATKTLNSSIMRAGLWHKVAFILLIATALVCSATALAWAELPDELATIYPGTCLYVYMMELISIVENISEINPDLKISKLFELFRINKEK